MPINPPWLIGLNRVVLLIKSDWKGLRKSLVPDAKPKLVVCKSVFDTNPAILYMRPRPPEQAPIITDAQN
jgi:hypothetical protein